MNQIASANPLPRTPTFEAIATVVPGDGFETRWAAWAEHGRIHERRARRRFMVGAAVVAMGAAILYVWL